MPTGLAPNRATVAKRAKPGLFEATAGGTLFLDAIDALPLAVQGKLLTTIEAKRVRRVGAVREQAVDVERDPECPRELRCNADPWFLVQTTLTAIDGDIGDP